MRVAIGISFMSVVAAEMIAAESGVGFLIMQSRLTIQTERIFVGLVLLGILGFLADRLFGPFMRSIAGRYTRHLGSGR
jgi:ABC-type nitrate/sulfonate/bicarbonate transport system permease component